MPSIPSSQLPKPKSWDELEDIVWELYAREWKDAQRNGRSGQAQHGVDICGQPQALASAWAGIQCKVTEHLSMKEIKAEVAKAEHFQPALGQYQIATTAPRDANVQHKIRLLTEQRKRQGKFPVFIVFWEDITTRLTHSDHYDLLRKYYGEWLRLFGGVQEAKIHQLVLEHEKVQLKLVDVEARALQERWEALRAEVNGGYHEAVRGKVEILVNDLEQTSQGAPIPDELKGRVYRLATNVVLPYHLTGDTQRARHFLALASQYSIGAATVQCQVMEAIIVFAVEGSSAALTALAGVTGDEAARLRFGLLMQEEQFDSCATWLAGQDENALLNSPDWARLLAFYAAVRGDRPRLETALERLLVGTSTADHLMIAGQVCLRAAQYALLAFCRENRVSPMFHLADLPLEVLVDNPLEQRASTHFREAARLFEEHGCLMEAEQALEAAARSQLDVGIAEAGETLANLARLAPQHPLVVTKVERWADLPDKAKFSQIKSWLEMKSQDPGLVLNAIHQLRPSKNLARRLIKLLQGHAVRFAISDDAYGFYLTVLVELRYCTYTTTTPTDWLEQLDPPQQYRHLATLLPAVFFHNRQLHDRAAEWLDRALDAHPQHPEVLAVAVQMYRASGKHDRQLVFARQLRQLLRAPQTVAQELQALNDCHDFEGFIVLAEQSTDLKLPEDALHTGLAKASLHMGRLLDAQKHIEWLRDNGQSNPSQLIQLAWVNYRLGQTERALTVLQKCVEGYPNEPAGYLALSEVCLVSGHRTESFDWALRARRRFPADERVAFHFGLNSFWTGFEQRPDVHAALREFRPGGQFAYTNAVVNISQVEYIEKVRTSHARYETLYGLYRRSQLPALLMCYGQSPPQLYAGFHFGGIRHHWPRYAANGAQTDRAEWLAKHNPQAVVLDYSALLTLRSLYGHIWLEHVRKQFGIIWISPKLLDILSWEEMQLSQAVQPARQTARTAILKVIRLPGSTIQIHPMFGNGSQGQPAWPDPTQEIELAAQLGVPYLNAYADQEERQAAADANVLVIGLVQLANILEAAGDIDPDVRDHLIAQKGPLDRMPPGNTPLPASAGLVASPLTLISIAAAGALDTLLRYAGTLHLSRSGWQWLEQETADFDDTEQVCQSLRELHREVGQAIQDGFVQLGVAPLVEQQLMTQSEAGVEHSVSENPHEFALVYLVDLLYLAHRHDIPLWADDRWTSELRAGERRPPISFGTDTFLEWQRLIEIDPDRIYADYARLVEWQYRGLPFHAEYCAWLLTRGVRLEQPRLANAIRMWRDYVIEFATLAKGDSTLSNDFAVRLIGVHNSGLARALRVAYDADVPLESAAGLLQAAGLAREDGLTNGREPNYYASLLVHALNDAIASLSKKPIRSLLAFAHWLDDALRASGLSSRTIEDAWYGLLQQPVLAAARQSGPDTMSETASEAQAYLRLLFAAAPEQVQQYLVHSDIGPSLIDSLEIVLQPTTRFELQGPTGTHSAMVPSNVWPRDIQTALERYLAERPNGPVNAGAMTVQAGWYAPGSIFLTYNALPNELFREAGGFPPPDRWVCIIEAGRVRGGIWQEALAYQVQQRLAHLGLAGFEAAISDVEHTLLSCWPVIHSYLREAIRLGPQAFQLVLVHLTPAAVRSWISLPLLNWTSPESLTNWAEGLLPTAGSVPDYQASNAGWLASLEHLEYSIFADAQHWHAAFAAQCSTWEQAQIDEIADRLLRRGEEAISSALKANTLFALLTLEQIHSCLTRTAALHERAERLLADLAHGWAGPDEIRQAWVGIECAVCEYLYVKWERLSQAVEAREIAYLAQVAAGHIMDAVGVTKSPPLQNLISLAVSLREAVAPLPLAVPDTKLEPVGLFRPGWTQFIPYALCYVLGGNKLTGTAFATLAARPISRAALLRLGLIQRWQRAYLPLVINPLDWLDQTLDPDPTSAIATALVSAETSEWPELDQQALLVCLAPEAEQRLLSEQLERLAEADEPEVAQVVWVAFSAAPALQDEARARVQATLLAPEPMRAIRRFPNVYAELVWRLLELLTRPERLADDLLRRAREIAFGISDDTGSRGKVFHAHAMALAVALMRGAFVTEILQWLRDIAATETQALADIRRALEPFLDLWPEMPGEVQRDCVEVLLKIAEAERYQGLWEFSHLRRNWNSRSSPLKDA